MSTTLCEPRDPFKGEQALMSGLRSIPRATSAHLGCNEVRICNWSSRVEEYPLPAVPEFIVALHTSGDAVERRGGPASAGLRSRPGQVTIRPPGISDRYRPRGPFRCTTAHIPVTRVQVLADAVGHARAIGDVPYRFGVDDPMLGPLLTALAREIESPAQYGSMLLERMLDALILHVLRGSASTADLSGGARLAPAIWQRVRARIEASLAYPITVADLAGEAGLSSFHFTRAFKLTSGQTPHRYLTERRIERAKTLLLHGQLPISRVALETGFTTQQHFTGTFRRFTGYAPAAFRKSHWADHRP